MADKIDCEPLGVIGNGREHIESGIKRVKYRIVTQSINKKVCRFDKAFCEGRPLFIRKL